MSNFSKKVHSRIGSKKLIAFCLALLRINFLIFIKFFKTPSVSHSRLVSLLEIHPRSPLDSSRAVAAAAECKVRHAMSWGRVLRRTWTMAAADCNSSVQWRAAAAEDNGVQLFSPRDDKQWHFIRIRYSAWLFSSGRTWDGKWEKEEWKVTSDYSRHLRCDIWLSFFSSEHLDQS